MLFILFQEFAGLQSVKNVTIEINEMLCNLKDAIPPTCVGMLCCVYNLAHWLLLQRNFVESMAGYSLVCYLLQVNVLVTLSPSTLCIHLYIYIFTHRSVR